MASFLHDLRYAVRQLLFRPSSTLLAVLALALGIGVVTAQFTVVKGLMLQMLPYETSDDRIYRVFWNHDKDSNWWSGSILRDHYPILKERQTSFQSLSAEYSVPSEAHLGDDSRYIDGAVITPDTLDTLGVDPILGRPLLEGDTAGEPVVLISHRLWKNDFGGHPDIIGKTIRVKKLVRTIVGVMPEGFHFPFSADIWFTYEFTPGKGKRIWFGVFGRLKEGVTLEHAKAEFDAIALNLAEDFPETNRHLRSATIEPYVALYSRFGAENMHWSMLGATVLVLLVACANVANLTLARLTHRSHELAVRSALGASRHHLFSRVLTETALIAGAGGVLGLGLSFVFRKALDQWFTYYDPPFWADFSVDGTTLMCVIGVSCAAALVSGLVPAWRCSRSHPADALKDAGRTASSVYLGKISSMLVMAQIGIAVALLIGSGLLIGNILSMVNIESPFPTKAILQGSVTLVDYQDRIERQQFVQRARNEFLRQPEVRSASVVFGTWGYGGWSRRHIDIRIEGEDYPDLDTYPAVYLDYVSPGLFETFNGRLIDGRDFNDFDTDESTPVSIINESFARRFFPDQNPIGRRLRRVGEDFDRELEAPPYRTIVGVVSDLLMEGLEERGSDGSGVYFPLYQYAPYLSNCFLLRGHDNNGRSLEPVFRDTLRRIDSRLVVRNITTPEESIQAFLAPRRMTGTLFLIFGAVSVILAAIGVYGVVSFSVTQKRREFGVRAALGSTAREIGLLVIRNGTRQAIAGIVVGVLLASALGRYLLTLVQGLRLYDPRIYLAAAALILGVVLVACLVPTWRAVQIQPAEALREK